MGFRYDRPTHARPGTEEKVLILQARCEAGLPLFDHRDLKEHGPAEDELQGRPQIPTFDELEEDL